MVSVAGVLVSAVLALVAIHVVRGSADPVTAVDSTNSGDAQRQPDPAVAHPSTLAEAFAMEATPLIRTDFIDDAAWQELVDQASKPVDFDHPDNPDPGEDGYVPYIAPVEDRRYEAMSGPALADIAMAADLMQGYALLADARSMSEAAAGGELTVTYVDLSPYAVEDAKLFDTFPGNSFRCVVTEVASIEANLSIANLDFSDFVDSVDADGVYRASPGE
jgi:hypothetical protein